MESPLGGALRVQRTKGPGEQFQIQVTENELEAAVAAQMEAAALNFKEIPVMMVAALAIPVLVESYVMAPMGPRVAVELQGPEEMALFANGASAIVMLALTFKALQGMAL